MLKGGSGPGLGLRPGKSMSVRMGILRRLQLASSVSGCGSSSASSSFFSHHVLNEKLPEASPSAACASTTRNFYSLSSNASGSAYSKPIGTPIDHGGRGSASLRCKERGNKAPLRLVGSASVGSAPSLLIGNANVTTTTTTSTDLAQQKRMYTINASDSDSSSDRLLVVGSGVAGCAAALVATQTHKEPVTLLFAGSVPTDCNSYWAQGGIIYRNYDPSASDSAESLANDIHRAGAGLCVDDAVWKVATEGPDRVRQLLLDERRENERAFANVPFDRLTDGSLSHCLEASHAAPRILHRADSTGAAITQHITQAAVNHPLVNVVSDTIVTDLAVATDPATGQRVCVGAHVLNRRTRETSVKLATRGTLLASGGLAGIYEHSTNPSGFNALGSSTAIATRAGAKTEDLEYVQFHPTSLYLPNEARFLLTEALRGEGAILRDANGRAFAKDFHVDGELAPRDVVARGVYAEAQKAADGDVHNAYLDITHRDADWLRGRFPTIDAHLAERNLDITKDRLPIIPAAHYTCGGIETDLDGRTTLTGLYSAGEAARTGLHGGNRLASTSLLEGLVYGGAVADFVGSNPAGEEAYNSTRSALSSPFAIDEIRDQASRTAGRNILVNGEAQSKIDGATSLLSDIKSTMWNGVGVVRTPSGISAALERLIDMKEEAEELYEACPTFETAAVRDAACAGEAVARAALNNRVSRGAHTIILEEENDEEDSDDEEVTAHAAGV